MNKDSHTYDLATLSPETFENVMRLIEHQTTDETWQLWQIEHSPIRNIELEYDAYDHHVNIEDRIRTGKLYRCKTNITLKNKTIIVLDQEFNMCSLYEITKGEIPENV